MSTPKQQLHTSKTHKSGIDAACPVCRETLAAELNKLSSADLSQAIEMGSVNLAAMTHAAQDETRFRIAVMFGVLSYRRSTGNDMRFRVLGILTKHEIAIAQQVKNSMR